MKTIHTIKIGNGIQDLSESQLQVGEAEVTLEYLKKVGFFDEVAEAIKEHEGINDGLVEFILWDEKRLPVKIAIKTRKAKA